MADRRRIFVFGSNTQGRHGRGAAKCALYEHGAILGQAEGLQGNSYAIITKELRPNYPRVTIERIAAGVVGFLWFAHLHPEMDFEVTPIGCGLAGYSAEWIAPLFSGASANVLLPESFRTILTQKHKEQR